MKNTDFQSALKALAKQAKAQAKQREEKQAAERKAEAAA